MTAAAQAQVPLWTEALSFGVSTTETAVDIVADKAGNVYSVGTTGSDVFVASYTQQGIFRWSNTFVGAGGGVDRPTEAVTDAYAARRQLDLQVWGLGTLPA